MAELPGPRSLQSGATVPSPGNMSAATLPTDPPTTSCSIHCAEVLEMARGDRPLPFEQLEPYMRGAKFAAVALGRRHMDHDPDLADDAARYEIGKHTSELQSRFDLVCRLLLEKKKN